jgi:hypothetical protein
MSFLKNPMAWILVLIMYFQYKKTSSIQKIMYGKKLKYSIGELLTTSILFGLIVGLIGTIIITVMGITFYELSGFIFIIITSLVLMLVNPMYLCLSYSGGLWSLLILIVSDLVDKGYISEGNIVFGFIYNNLKFDVTSLMVVIAVLQLMEALLMRMDGARGALPVFIRRNGRVVGAFILQRFWIIPAIIFTAGSIGILPFTSWWPIIKPPIQENIIKNIMFMAVPFITMLGYSDIAISTDARNKVKRSSGKLFVFSITLLILSILSTEYYIFKYIAAIFAPLAQEIFMYIETSKEIREKPLWQYSEDGIIVLDTIPDTPSEAMGIKSGEKIININNIRIKSMEDAGNALKSYPTFVWIELMNKLGQIRTVEYKDYVNGVKSLGIITVPRDERGLPMMREREGFLKKITRNKR